MGPWFVLFAGKLSNPRVRLDNYFHRLVFTISKETNEKDLQSVVPSSHNVSTPNKVIIPNEQNNVRTLPL